MAFGNNGGGYAGGNGSGGGGGGGNGFKLAKFSAPASAPIAKLIGKTPDIDFAVWDDNGGGTLLFLDTGDGVGGYTFNSGTGVITVPAASGDYRVLYNN